MQFNVGALPFSWSTPWTCSRSAKPLVFSRQTGYSTGDMKPKLTSRSSIALGLTLYQNAKERIALGIEVSSGESFTDPFLEMVPASGGPQRMHWPRSRPVFWHQRTLHFCNLSENPRRNEPWFLCVRENARFREQW